MRFLKVNTIVRVKRPGEYADGFVGVVTDVMQKESGAVYDVTFTGDAGMQFTVGYMSRDMLEEWTFERFEDQEGRFEIGCE